MGETGYGLSGVYLTAAAAYRAALGEKVVCMNLIINSKEPHPPVEAPWSEELVIQHIGARWEAKNLFDVPRDKAAEILKRPADFIRGLKQRSQPEMSF